GLLRAVVIRHGHGSVPYPHSHLRRERAAFAQRVHAKLGRILPRRETQNSLLHTPVRPRLDFREYGAWIPDIVLLTRFNEPPSTYLHGRHLGVNISQHLIRNPHIRLQDINEYCIWGALV